MLLSAIEQLRNENESFREMIAVIFDVYPHGEHKQQYFDIAASLRLSNISWE